MTGALMTFLLIFSKVACDSAKFSSQAFRKDFEESFAGRCLKYGFVDKFLSLQSKSDIFLVNKTQRTSTNNIRYLHFDFQHHGGGGLGDRIAGLVTAATIALRHDRGFVIQPDDTFGDLFRPLRASDITSLRTSSRRNSSTDAPETKDWTHLWNTYENISISQRKQDTRLMQCHNNPSAACGMDVDLKDKTILYIGNRAHLCRWEKMLEGQAATVFRNLGFTRDRSLFDAAGCLLRTVMWPTERLWKYVDKMLTELKIADTSVPLKSTTVASAGTTMFSKSYPSAATTGPRSNPGPKSKSSPPGATLRGVQQNGAPVVIDKNGTSVIKKKASSTISTAAGSDCSTARVTNTELSTNAAAATLMGHSSLLATTGSNSQAVVSKVQPPPGRSKLVAVHFRCGDASFGAVSNHTAALQLEQHCINLAARLRFVSCAKSSLVKIRNLTLSSTSAPSSSSGITGGKAKRSLSQLLPSTVLLSEDKSDTDAGTEDIIASRANRGGPFRGVINVISGGISSISGGSDDSSSRSSRSGGDSVTSQSQHENHQRLHQPRQLLAPPVNNNHNTSTAEGALYNGPLQRNYTASSVATNKAASTFTTGADDELGTSRGLVMNTASNASSNGKESRALVTKPGGAGGDDVVLLVFSDNPAAAKFIRDSSTTYPTRLTTPRACHVDFITTRDCQEMTYGYWFLLSLSDYIISTGKAGDPTSGFSRFAMIYGLHEDQFLESNSCRARTFDRSVSDASRNRTTGNWICEEAVPHKPAATTTTATATTKATTAKGAATTTTHAVKNNHMKA